MENSNPYNLYGYDNNGVSNNSLTADYDFITANDIYFSNPERRDYYQAKNSTEPLNAGSEFFKNADVSTNQVSQMNDVASAQRYLWSLNNQGREDASRDFCKSAFGNVDTNKDGLLSLPELLIGSATTSEGLEKKTICMMLKHFDHIKSLSDDQTLWETGISKNDLLKVKANDKYWQQNDFAKSMKSAIEHGHVDGLRALVSLASQSDMKEIAKRMEEQLSPDEKNLHIRAWGQKKSGETNGFIELSKDDVKLVIPADSRIPVQAFKKNGSSAYNANAQWEPIVPSDAVLKFAKPGQVEQLQLVSKREETNGPRESKNHTDFSKPNSNPIVDKAKTQNPSDDFKRKKDSDALDDILSKFELYDSLNQLKSAYMTPCGPVYAPLPPKRNRE